MTSFKFVFSGSNPNINRAIKSAYRLKSAMKKLTTDPDVKSIDDIEDLARNTFVAKNDLQKWKIIDSIKTNFEAMPLKEQNTPLRYTGAIVNIKHKGVISEIQINTAQMIYGKHIECEARMFLGDEIYNKLAKSGIEGGLGHKYYEEWRDVKTTAKRKAELEKLSKAYYDKIRNIRL